MSWLRYFQRGKWDEERAREIQAHLTIETEENVARGLSREQARSAAVRKLGNELQIREEIYRMNSLSFVETLWQDLRYGARMLRRNAGFTSIAVLTLALGIGANTTIFSVVRGVLLRPLPYPQSNRLVYLRESNPKHGWPRFSVSPANFLDWRAQTSSFEHVVAYAYDSVNVSMGDVPEQWPVIEATQGFFETLRVRPELGSTFRADDYANGKGQVLVLGDAIWHRAFGGDPAVIGRTISLGNTAYTVIGVMPPDFHFGGDDTLAYLPYTFSPRELNARGAHYLNCMGRLRDEISIAAAQAEMTTLSARLESEYPDSNQDWGSIVESMQVSGVRGVHDALLVLLGAVGFVLLIACSNVANMLLSRAAVRRREMAIRLTLGAGRWRIVRQVLTESVILSLIGGAAGLTIAFWAARALAALPASLLPRASFIHVDGPVLAFTLILAVGTGVFFGMAPALGVLRGELRNPIAHGNPRSGSNRTRFRDVLVVTEVALAFTLFVGAALLLRSFARLTSVEPGFQTESRLTFRIDLPSSYAKPEQWIGFFDAAQQRLQNLPGVESSTLTSLVPLSGRSSVLAFGTPGQPSSTSLPSAEYYLVSAGYVRDMGIPLMAGREFTAQDAAPAARVCLINDNMARTIFPGRNPIGQRIQISTSEYAIPREIVGVVGSVKQRGLDYEAGLQVYEPFAQSPHSSMNVVMKTSANPSAMIPSVRRAVEGLDSQLPISKPYTLDGYLEQTVALPRLRALLLGVFAALAVALALVGLYGVLSYTVAQQAREIGIRMALGAQRKNIYILVLARGLTLVAIGIAIGAAGALALATFVADFLFDVNPRDPVTMITVAILFAIVAVLACCLPARKAIGIDPMAALRYE